ncbi:MAG: aldose epimerase family protein [Methyloligellaceae bacterium]
MSNRQIIRNFGTCTDGSTVHLVTLENGGTIASIMTWGASLQDFRRHNTDYALILGSPEFSPYLGDMRYFGATAGPVANRIANGRAPLNGKFLDLDKNENGITTLHGGHPGCSDLNWKLAGYDSHSCRLTLHMEDGLCGFPGNRDFATTYTLEEDGALVIEMEGRTDALTFCNLAHHSYWNLDNQDTIAAHRLTIYADSYLPVDHHKIPIGSPKAVSGTSFDFRTPSTIGKKGYSPLDHNFCLQPSEKTLNPACILEGSNGIKLSVQTTEPGLQVYDGEGLSTESVGHEGKSYGAMAGIALEPQLWPDAPNQTEYPSILLYPGEVYHQISRFEIFDN